MLHKSKMLMISIGIFSLTLFSCKKEIKESNITIPGNETLAGVPIPPLDWENIDFMPMPPGTFQVPTPWGSGGSDQIAPEMLDDYLYSDGWRLVYNTFNTTLLPDNYYFMLYNVYRGILRLYFYVPPTANYQFSDNIVHALSLEKSYAASSPMMNFAGQNVVSMNWNSLFASAIEEAKVGPAEWYALQFELAYDKNMHNQNYLNFIFDWNIEAANISNIKLNGTSTGTIVGSINVEGSNFTIGPSFSLDKSRGNITINGESVANKLNPTLGTSIVNGIKSGIQKGLEGILKNVLSGIFKRETAMEDNVHLKIETDIKLDGTQTDDFLVTSPKFAIPGYNQTNTTGYIPAYNEPLGVFYLNQAPTVNVTRVHFNTGIRETSSTLYGYNIAPNSYQLEFNPAVLANATIQNITQEVVLTHPQSYMLDINGDLEMVGTTSIYTNLMSITVPYLRFPPPGIAVRIGFDVVPNNGAPAVRIGHTFHPIFANQW